MASAQLDSDLLHYIVDNKIPTGSKLPSLEELSGQLDLSTSKLREQLEVARCLGLVEVRPRLGIRLSDYSFLPAVRFSLLYAVAKDPAQFEAFSTLRHHLEACFWEEAVAQLTPADHAHLQQLVQAAWAKLQGRPIRIPHAEHRDLHLSIFSRLANPFVKGLLEAYWEAYEAVGLNVYSDYQYLREVWTYHENIVKAIIAGDVPEGYRLLLQHTHLIRHREK